LAHACALDGPSQAEYALRQAALKAEPLEVIYSYYNGTGHRRAVMVRKGDTVGQFLKAVIEQLTPQFREIRWDARVGAGFARLSFSVSQAADISTLSSAWQLQDNQRGQLDVCEGRHHPAAHHLLL
jgi:hypothetical protein